MAHVVAAFDQESQREAVDLFVPHGSIAQFDQLFRLSGGEILIGLSRGHVLKEVELPIGPLDVLESEQELRQTACPFGVALQRIDFAIICHATPWCEL